MASDDNGSGDIETKVKTSHSESSDVSHKQETRILRRETVLATERQRGALIAALCSLAGVGMGFGLGQFVSANNNCAHHSVVVEVPKTPNVSCQAQAQAVTWLGVKVTSHHAMYRQRHPAASGAEVVAVIPGSPAEAVGLQVDDVIVSFDAQQIIGSTTLIDSVRVREIGQRVNIVWIRNGKHHQRNVELGAITPRRLRRLQP